MPLQARNRFSGWWRVKDISGLKLLSFRSKWRWCTDQISTVPAYVAAIENSLIDHPCHTNITRLAVITSAR
jgi:hypothetical protein